MYKIRKTISFILCFAIMLSFSTFVNAQEANDPDVKITYLTEDQFVKDIAKRKGISEKKVRNNIESNKQKVLSKNSISALMLSANGTRYVQAIKTKNFAEGSEVNYEVELGVYYIEYSYDSFRQINSIEDAWTGASASGDYTWSEYSLVHTSNDELPDYQIEAHARGAVETVLDISTSIGLELKNDLVGIGFSITQQFGSKVYLRKVGNVDLDVSLY